jgi:hypothetical protein
MFAVDCTRISGEDHGGPPPRTRLSRPNVPILSLLDRQPADLHAATVRTGPMSVGLRRGASMREHAPRRVWVSAMSGASGVLSVSLRWLGTSVGTLASLDR